MRSKPARELFSIPEVRDCVIASAEVFEHIDNSADDTTIARDHWRNRLNEGVRYWDGAPFINPPP